MLTKLQRSYTIALGLGLVVLSGCATVPGPRNPSDPWESYNRTMYKVNDRLDRAVLKPVAQGYRKVVPELLRVGVNNFFSNLGDVAVAVNDVFQGKFRQAASDGGRVLVNSTIGLFGVIDVGTQIGLRKHNEDFGQTLGYWGVTPGPYLIVPLLGPSTVRDSLGGLVDAPLTYWPYINVMRVRNITYMVDSVKARANVLDTEKVLDEAAALDPYAFTRDSFLQRRNSLVYDGNVPRKPEEEMEENNEPQLPSKEPASPEKIHKQDR